MPFALRFSDEARTVIRSSEEDPHFATKLAKLRKCLGQLERDPRHPGLRTHRYHSLTGPAGQDVWEAYVENQASSAWRVWFWYGPDRDVITILTIGPHPQALAGRSNRVATMWLRRM
jgi:hypothetical protein